LCEPGLIYDFTSKPRQPGDFAWLGCETRWFSLLPGFIQFPEHKRKARGCKPAWTDI